MNKIFTIFLVCICIANANRILFENTKTSDKWQFTLFSSAVEQNTQSIILSAQNLLLIQNLVDEQGLRQIKFAIHQKDSTQIGARKIYSNEKIEYIRAQALELDNQNLVFSWIQIAETGYSLYIQLFDKKLNEISNQIQIGLIHKEVSWDLVSEFYQIKQINDDQLLIIFRDQSKEKSWTGHFYNIKNSQQSSQFTLDNSNNLQIAINSINTIVILQKIQNSMSDLSLVITKVHQNGFVLMTRTLYKMGSINEIQYLPQLVALSNNNFVVLFQQNNQIVYYVYDQHFNSQLFNSRQKYQTQQPVMNLDQNDAPIWEYNNYFHGGQVQLTSLKGSLVITGINYDNLRFQLVQLDNDYLEFVQFREIHYEDLNIYKFNTQKLDDYSVFVSWIDGQPQTMLPEFVQSLYLSSLNLKLTLTNCDTNCQLCQEDGTCKQCNDGYQINNNSCILSCIQNCSQCSTDSTCDVCNSGFNLNNQLQCVDKNSSNILELQASISETTYKFNQKFRVLNNKNILSLYQEQLGSDFYLQLRLIDTLGNVINSLQLSTNNIIDYDFIVQSAEQAYLYSLEINEGYYGIKQAKFNPVTLEFQTSSRLQIQNQGFTYTQNIKDSLIALQFENTVGFIVQGLDFSQNIFMSVYIYTYDGQFINSQYIGYIQNLNFNFDFKYFDYQIDNQYLYIFINKNCDHYLLTLDQNGNRISDSYSSQFTGYTWCNLIGGNPSLQKIQNTNKFMIAIEQWQSIFVFLWQDTSIIYQTKNDINTRKPTLIAYSEQKFSLIYEKFDYDRRFNTLEYIVFNGDSVQYQQTINQRSFWPSELQIWNDNYEYLIFSWLGYKDINSNQIYLQQFSLIDQQLLGVGKQCPTNCQVCDQDKNCQQCKSNYQLQSNNVCQLICSNGCSKCSENACLICQSGYQLNKSYQCEIYKSNLISIIQQDTNQLQLIDLDTNSNGNILISWMNIDPSTNNKQTYIKQIDQNGNQVGDDFKVNQCTSTASKVYSRSSFNVISTICGNIEQGVNVDLHFYDTNFNFRFQFWAFGTVRMFQYSIQDTPYDILFISDREFIMVLQYMNSFSDVSFRIIRVLKHDNDNSFYVNNDRSYYIQSKFNNLKLSQDQTYIYTEFYVTQILDDGSTQIINRKLTFDYNCDLQKDESFVNQKQQYYKLSNSNQIKIQSSKQNIEVFITSNNKQLHYEQILISDQVEVQNVDGTVSEVGFYLSWIEKDQNTAQSQIKAQGFFNNGTQITDIVSLNQNSIQPNNLQIQALQGNQLIVLWYDQSQQGESIYLARYNMFLQITPLNTLLCLAHCDSCTQNNSCNNCSSGYHFNSQKEICELTCIDNCEICSQNQNCDVCYEGYYLINNQCIADNSKQEEVVLSDIKDSQKTRVSIANFNDYGFVVAWNDDYNGQQSIFLRFYDSQRLPIGDQNQRLSSESDQQYVKVESFDDDTFAISWFEGNCADSCRLVFQVLDRNGNAVIQEQTIALLKLPPLELQSPVVMKRKGKNMIIAYISYENNKTIGYYTNYGQDSIISTPNIIDPDNNVDNLEVFVYNEQNYCIYYVRNNQELFVLQWINNELFRQNSLYTSANQIKTPSAIARANGDIIVSWVETVLTNGNWMEEIGVFICTYSNECFWQRYLESNQQELQKQTKLIGQYGFFDSLRYSIIYQTYDYLSPLRRKINLVSYYYYDWDRQSNQLNIMSYIIRYYDLKEFSNGEIILVSVGQLGDSSSKLLITKFDLLGNQQLLGNVFCQSNCGSCRNNQECISCKTGYTLNNNQCEKECDLNCKYCDPYWNQSGFQCYECDEGFQLNSQQQCQAIDNSISQQLINTYQTGNQYDQKVAVLQNQQSIIVWTSENQNQNGKSIYMQLYDQQFNKVGSETLVTKDNIGVQEQPDIIALQNNEFIIIWKDNNSSSGRRILMQRFNDKYERAGDAITVYDSSVDLYLNGENPITYLDSYHQIVSSQNGHLAVLILLKVSQNLYDIRLKQFNEKYQEYNSIAIGSTVQFDQCQLNALNNLLFVTWKSTQGIRIKTINDQGSIVNGELVSDSTQYSNPTISPVSEEEIILVYSKSNQLIIQKYDIQLQKVNDLLQVKSDFQITSIQVVNIDSGYVVVYKELKQTQYYSSDLIYFISFDSNGGKLSQSKVIVNNLYGNIRDLRLSAFSNGEVLISWTQLINYYLTDQIIRDRNLNDLSGDGIYIKRYNLSGNVQSIQNVVCQTYCKQCSKSNLCEVCADGYQFDQYKLICQPICSPNCQSCSRYLGQYKSYCQQCQDGYTVNEKGDCSKIIQQDSLLFHSVGGGEWQIRQILTLENQSIVVIKQIYQDDAYFSVIDQSGNLIAKEIWLENSCCQKVIKASALATGGFVVVYRSFRYWDDQNMLLNVYDNIGTRIKQQVLQTFATWGYYYWWDYPYANRNLFQIKSLNGGGFILLYMTDNDGSRYHNPQMYFRIYNQEYSVVSNDVKLKTYFNNNYYWDWAPAGYYQQTNYENLNILENGNQIIISFGTSLYNGWDESKNYIQLFIYDKQGQFQQNKQVQVVNDQYYWWNNGYSPRFYLFQRSQDQYLLISFQNQKVFGFYLDSNFQQIIQKSIDQSYYWDPCYGCCESCWNQNTIQIIVMKNTLMISSKSDPSRLQLQSFNYNLEPITNPKQIGISRQNSGLLWNHFIQLYNSEAVLITQIIDNYDFGLRNVVFNLFDNKINKLEWNQCDVNCINCLDSQKQCIDCKSGYYLNDQKQCKSYCIDSNCAQCDYSGINIQKCSICNVGFELKDNSLCIAIDSSKIRETLLAISQHDGQNTPRIKTFSNGEFLLITLHNQNEIYAQYYNQVGQKVGNEVLLVSFQNINHFDFSISKQEDMIVVAWVTSDQQSRLQRFNIDLSQISDPVYILYWIFNSANQITVQLLQNYNIIYILYNNEATWLMLFNQNDNLIFLTQIEFDKNLNYCYWWGCYQYCSGWACGQWVVSEWGYWNYLNYYNQHNYLDDVNRMYDFWNIQNDVNQKYIDYFSYWYAREPSTVVTDNYIIVVAQHFDSIHAQTFDYNGNLLYQQYYRLFAPYQPSVAQLQNGKIVIVWKDIIQNVNDNPDNQSVPKYKQTVIAYTITDEQFNTIRIQYIGMDYVQEERPDVTAISNGFAISFSGRSEITNANIDLRIAYFDLNGNIQTGFISVSSQSSQPINSNLAQLNDGSLIVSWYQNEEIYVQKIDRSGTIQKLINDIICPSNCKVCKLTNYCQICSDGYHIDDQHQCQENTQPQCQIGNCQICEDGSDRCQLCQNGYFLDENLNMCNQLDNQQNVEIIVAKSNVFQDHSTQILQLNDGTIIHLWLQQNGDNFEIWGQTFTYDGSLSLDQRLIIQLAQEVQFKGTAKNSNILILIYNQKSTRVLEISQDLKIVNNNEITDLIAKSFTVSYEWYNSQIQLFDNGYLIQITGIKQQAINQMSNNPEIKRCRVTELFIFDMTGQQIVPEFTFWLNDQQSSGFLDQNNECKYQDIAHILYEDTQFYVLQQKNRDWNQIYLSIFDYNGQKLQEYWVSDWGAAYWDPAYWNLIISRDQINLIRLGNGELGIINKQGQGYIFDSNYCRYRDISINANTYFYNDYQVQSLQNEYNVFVETQSFGQTQRNKYYTFRSWDSGWIGKINFISQFTVYQGSFNVLKLQNGEILFNWMEQQNNDRQGSIIIVRMNIQGDIIKFPTFSCQDHFCSYCTNVSTCKSCAQNYYLDNNNKCQPQCSDNCQSCSYPFTCDVCLEKMHVNDNQECIQTPSQLNPETSIPIKRSDEQDKPRVASFSDGSFVIVWQSLNQDGDGYGVYAQKFNIIE